GRPSVEAAGRVDRGLAVVGGSGGSGRQEGFALERIALGGINERGVVEDFVARLSMEGDAEVERLPRSVGVKAQAVFRIRIAEDDVIVASNPRRRDRTSQNSTRYVAVGVTGHCVVIEQLHAVRAPAGGYRSQPRSERLPRDDTLRVFCGLTFAAAEGC